MFSMLERSGVAVDTDDTVFCASGAAAALETPNASDSTTRTITNDNRLKVIICFRDARGSSIFIWISLQVKFLNRDILGFRYIAR